MRKICQKFRYNFTLQASGFYGAGDGHEGFRTFWLVFIHSTNSFHDFQHKAVLFL